MSGMPNKIITAREGRYQKMISASADSMDGDHNWLITLSDLLSLLLVFFIIIFAMTRVTAGKKEAPKPKAGNPPVLAALPLPETNQPTNKKLEDIQKDMRATVAGLSLDDQVMIQVMNQEILITMKENVTFLTGEADILKSSGPILDTIADVIKRYPSFRVEIDGHTDDLPINNRRFPSNWELSLARATSVLKYLIAHQGIEPDRFTIKGNGEQRPLSPNYSSEQRAQNRRVEIRLKDDHSNV